MPGRTLAEINSLTRDEFVHLLGPVFEKSPWIADAAWPRRPFADRKVLHNVLCQIVTDTCRENQVALICAHPDLADRLALPGSLTAESTAEQASAGLNQLTLAEAESFRQNNAAYRAKFGFPFVICARLNRKDAILNGFRARLPHSREQEIASALREIFKIAELRLNDLISP